MAVLASLNQAPVRRQFSFAHEHGHALMDHELDWQVLWLALEAWWREEISQGRLLEVGRLLNIEDETILDLAN